MTYYDEGSNVSIIPQFLKFLITKILKLKYQNKAIIFDLTHFIYIYIYI
jgi:hypothetical protein